MDLKTWGGFIPAPCFLCSFGGVLLDLEVFVSCFQSGALMFNSPGTGWHDEAARLSAQGTGEVGPLLPPPRKVTDSRVK